MFDEEGIGVHWRQVEFLQWRLQKYAWSNIFDPRLGGFELINLYGEAIDRSKKQ
ncbi:hypothetical protein AGMMS49944_28130 [Spirochaetia bacterium]|nr:hypothetical protein AGMMS49944_28130 [Spirochaetia bacterium]